jgi:DNA-binding MurR/RpiR family transcriptional regulator
LVGDNKKSLQLLFTMLPDLPETETLIARYILLNPADAKSMTVKELAAKCGVGEATVFRLCQRLGCAFKELKKGISTEEDNPLLLETPNGEDLVSLMNHIHLRINCALRDTLSLVDLDKIGVAVELLKKADKIFVCGTGPLSGNLAEIVAYKLQEVGCTAIPWSDNRPPNAVTSICTQNDVILGISHSGESKELGKILKLVKETGVKSITITNYLASTAGAHSDIVLATGIREPGMYQGDLVPRFGLLYIVNVLLAAIDFDKSRGVPRVCFFEQNVKLVENRA